MRPERAFVSARAGGGIAMAIAALLVAAPALASGGEEGAGLLYPMLNFVLLAGVLFVLLRKPIRAFFAERRSGIRSELDEAAKLKKQAEARYAKWQRRIVDLDLDLESLRTSARERAEPEREHILAAARASAERIRRDASAAIEQEVRRARVRLREEASDLAVERAAGMLKQTVDDRDRARLLDEFIERVESQPERPNGNGR